MRRPANRFTSKAQLVQHLASLGPGAATVVEKPRKPEKPATNRPQDLAIRKRRQAHPEHDAQVEVVNWVRSMQDVYPALRLFHAIPNGGYRSKKTAALMKAEGSLSGVPDLYLPVPRWWADGSVSHGLYIEMKAAKGRLSDNQKEIITLLREQGYRVEVCFSVEEAKAAIIRYLELEEHYAVF